MAINFYTEFTKEDADEDCQIRAYRAYSPRANLEQDDIKTEKTAGVLRAEVHDLAVHRSGDRK